MGIINTSYLSYHAITKLPVKCLWFPPEWCQKVQYSKYSKTLGIPNPFLGLLMYIAIFTLILMVRIPVVGGTPLPPDASTFNALTPLFWIITIGFTFSMYFTAIQAFVLKAFCTWCVISAIKFTLLFIAVLVLVR